MGDESRGDQQEPDVTTVESLPSFGGELRRNVLGRVESLVMSVAAMGPVLSMLFITPLIATHVGISTPLMVFVSVLIIYILARGIADFAREFPSAGGFFTYVVRGAGPYLGFVAGWLVFAGYLSFGPGNVTLIGANAQDLLSRLDIHVSWLIPGLILSAIVFLLSYFGINPSLKVGLITAGFEMIVLTVAVVAVVFQGGDSGFSLKPFTLAPGLGFGAIALGLAFGLDLFIGFDAAVTLGEEAREPRKTIPWAILATVVAIGVFYVIVSYVAVIGFGVSHGAAFSADALPWTTLATRYVSSWYGTLLDIAGLTAVFAVMIAANNLAVRVLFSMGRTGILPKAFGKSHPKYQTPYVAIIVAQIFYWALAIPFGLKSGPFVFFGYVSFVATLLILAVYILVLFAVMNFFRKQRRESYSLMWHTILPAVAMIALVFPIAGSVIPFPQSPYNFLVFLTVGWLVVGLIVGTYLRKNRPDEMSTAGALMSGLEGHAEAAR